MAVYKLIYFNGKGRAEPIRLMFKYAKVNFEDFRFERSEWPTIKETMPWGQVPALEVDGVMLAQTMAITRFLARKFDLAGEGEMEWAKCDEYADALSDFATEVYKVYFMEKDEAKKAELEKKFNAEVKPNYLKKMEAILEKNGTGFLVGKKLTFADIHCANFLEYIEEQFKITATEYPALMKHQALVLGQPGIKEWIEVRPKTPF